MFDSIINNRLSAILSVRSIYTTVSDAIEEDKKNIDCNRGKQLVIVHVLYGSKKDPFIIDSRNGNRQICVRGYYKNNTQQVRPPAVANKSIFYYLNKIVYFQLWRLAHSLTYNICDAHIWLSRYIFSS